MKNFKKTKNLKRRPINQFDAFYKQQFRKDLIDKLNLCSINEADLSFKLKFRGYLRYNAFERNAMSFKQILAYQYIFESIFSQRIMTNFFVKKNIQREEPSDFYYKFKCNIKDRKKVYYFLATFFANLYNQRLHKTLKKPILICDFKNSYIVFKNLKVYQSFWIKKFLDINLSKEFYSTIKIKTKPLIFLLLLSRLQFLPFIKITQNYFNRIIKNVPYSNTNKKIVNETIF